MNGRLLPWLRLVAVLALLPCAGCVPTVVWLPDSSGFVYMDSDWVGQFADFAGTNPALQDKLVVFDMATKTRRTLAKTGSGTLAPTLRPDGQRIAVAKLGLQEDKPATLQVVVYDLHGKEVRRSQAFPWGSASGGFPQLHWAPRGNKLLVHALERTGIYDLDRDRMTMVEGLCPIICGASPIRPDGQGFLFARDQPLPAFVDWEGKHTDIDLPEGGRFNPAHLPAVGWSRWEGHVAVLIGKGGELRIDTAAKTATLRPLGEADWSLDGKDILHLHTFPDGKTRIAVLLLTDWRGVSNGGLPQSVRVDLLGPAPGQRRTLVAATPHCGVYPSPNKESVVLRYWLEVKKNERYLDRMLVVNGKGEIVAEIGTGK